MAGRGYRPENTTGNHIHCAGGPPGVCVAVGELVAVAGGWVGGVPVTLGEGVVDTGVLVAVLVGVRVDAGVDVIVGVFVRLAVALGVGVGVSLDGTGPTAYLSVVYEPW